MSDFSIPTSVHTYGPTNTLATIRGAINGTGFAEAVWDDTLVNAAINEAILLTQGWHWPLLVAEYPAGADRVQLPLDFWKLHSAFIRESAEDAVPLLLNQFTLEHDAAESRWYLYLHQRWASTQVLSLHYYATGHGTLAADDDATSAPISLLIPQAKHSLLVNHRQTQFPGRYDRQIAALERQAAEAKAANRMYPASRVQSRPQYARPHVE